MSRIYSVKSNARRDARKLGLDPDLVKASGDGWIIDYPDATGSKPATSEKPAKPSANDKQSKGDRLVAMLADWTPVADLMAAMGWQAHTVRGALSTAARARRIKIERRRADGVTSYRVA